MQTEIFPPPHTTHDQKTLDWKDWLAISLIKGAGPTRLDRLWVYVDTLNQEQNDPVTIDQLDYALLIHLKWPKALANSVNTYLQSNKLDDEAAKKYQQTLKWLLKEGHELLFRDDDNYPRQLLEIPVPPVFLYVKGKSSILNKPAIGVVGARKCSVYGRQLAYQLSKELSQTALTVISGGAYGIDAAAHEGACDTNMPTVAVMGTGLENLYPSSHHNLFNTIIRQGGALISEYPIHTVARPNLFPPRNRIISGLSKGVLVIEAKESSGSLITAKYAVQHNREVFAIPGRLNDSNAAGCHRLIQQGAKLVMTVQDILDELSLEKEHYTPNVMSAYAGEQRSSSTIAMHDAEQVKRITMSKIEVDSNLSIVSKQVMGCFITSEGSHQEDKGSNDYSYFTFAELMETLTCSTSELMQALMELELFGYLVAYQNGYRPTT